MELKYYSKIASYWGMEMKECKILSERAFLLVRDDGKKFILKKKVELQRVKEEIELLNHLKSNRLRVQFPLVNRYGEYITAFNNDNYCLYDYLDGAPFSAIESLQKPIAPVLFGETIASLHKVMKTAGNATNFRSTDIYHTVFNWAIKEVLKVDDSQQLNVIFNNLDHELQPMIRSLPRQLIHRDTHISNIIFKDSQLSGVIDFEIAEINVRIFDICYCCTSILSEVFSDETLRETWFDFVAKLFSSYNKTNTLTQSEINSIWNVMLSIQTIFMAFFSNSPTLFEVNKSMLIWIYDNKTRMVGWSQ